MSTEKDDADKNDSVNNNSYFERPVILWLAALTVIAIIVIIVIGILIDDQTARINFLTVSILSVLSLIVVVISALTSRETARIMENQESEMRLQRQTTQKQLSTMQDTLSEMESQRVVMKGQLDLSEKLFDLSTMPRIIVTKAELEFPLISQTRPVAVIEFMNIGQGHADSVDVGYADTFMVRADLPPGDFSDKFSTPTWQRKGYGTIGPQGLKSVKIEATSWSLKNVPGLRDGYELFYVWGDIVYSDASNTYWTRFCLWANDPKSTDLAYFGKRNEVGVIIRQNTNKPNDSENQDEKADDERQNPN